jgi:hypothetical protein
MSALTRLAEKVEAGTATPADFVEKGLMENISAPKSAWKSYHGSLDAAMALHEAVLPGHGYGVGPWGARVWLYSDVPKWDGCVRHEVEMVDAPARAWLLAILRALAAGETP